MDLSTPVASIPFVGPIYASRLAKLGITTVEDFLHHYPFRYNDYSIISPIASLQAGETVTIQGEVTSFTNQYTRRRMTIQKAKVADSTGILEVTWFNQPFLEQSLQKGKQINLSGEIDYFHGKPVMTSPEYEILTPNAYTLTTIHTGRLVPIYPETRGVSSKWLRSRIVYLLSQTKTLIEEFLPESVISQYKLEEYARAIQEIHFPNNKDESDRARKRLAFDEVFIAQLASGLRKQKWKEEKTAFNSNVTRYKLQVARFIDQLPFKLTSAQERCVGEILSDLNQTKPMNRLLQGDVGSGKTVVAAIGMYVMHLAGYKSVLMAPTEILAQQHFETIQRIFKPFNIKVALVTSSSKQQFNNVTVKQYSLFIGTHALLFKKKFDRLGLVVIDEQHRFGVEQRASLQEMGVHPHLLAMTATPIPRSIALVMYSELDLSYIDEMPHGRLPIRTWLVPNEKRERAYEWIKKELIASAKGRNQVFIICPLIEESQHETMASVKAVTKEFESLKKIFRELKLGLLHGRLKSKEKKETLDKFASQELDILVATPVVEVGIDIPNATIMVIEASERFGLAQLHQLRGRVGRSDKQSYCLLFTESAHEKTIKRLKSLEKNNNGAKLAEIDLELRGPGELYGTHQHGFASFKLASFSDHPLIALAKEAAITVLATNELHMPSPLRNKLKNYTIRRVNPN